MSRAASARRRAALGRGVSRFGLIVWALGSAIGCHRAAPTPSAVTVAYPRGLVAAEPNRDIEEFSLSILGNVFEGLVDIDGNLALKPALAESWSSPDDLSWIFRIRPGVLFHDGAVLTAEDVVRSLEHLRADRTQELSPTLAEVVEIRVDEPLIVRMRTRFPVPSLPYHLSALLISKPGADPAHPVGTGPYRLASWTPGGDTVLEAFTGHWAGPPRVAVLRFRTLSDAAARVAALRRGEVDLAVDVPAGEMPALGAEPGLRTLSARGLRVIFLGLVSAGSAAAPDAARRPLSDPNVRRAVALAIDRDRLARSALGGQAEVVDQILAPEVFGYSSDLPRIPHDPDEARRLLRDAGYGAGFDLTLDFAAERYRAMDAVSRLLSEDLAAVGVRVTPRPSATDPFFARLERRDSELFLLGWMSSGDAPLTYDYLLHRREAGQGSNNYTGVDDPEFDRLIEAAELEPSTARRGARLRDLAERVQRSMPFVPLYRQFDLYALRSGLAFTPRPDRRIRGIELTWTDARAVAAGAR